MRGLLLVSAVLLAVSAAAPAAYAELERVGPTVPAHGYPAWYQDKTGLVLEFCQPLNQGELDGGWCLLLPADIPNPANLPETFPDNFSEEHFYWAADAGIDFPNPNAPGGTGRARLVLGLEAAFAVGPPIPGDQVTFGRVRVTINDLPSDGTYTVYHPYGVEVFPNEQAGGKIFFTSDIGINCPAGQFDCAQASQIGPFLLPSNLPGDVELTAVAGPVPGKLYIADPARLGPITGSPLPDLTASDGLPRNHNIFRIEGPNGFAFETTDFALMGRVFTGAIPGKVTVNRASYAASASGSQLDVFATAFPTTQGRLPASPKPASVTPVLAFYPAACGVDPVTQAFIEPAGVPGVQMFNAGNNFWGQSHPAPNPIPPMVCVEDYTARNANGQVVPAFFQAGVTDQVIITEAYYDPSNGGTLSVAANSSDAVIPPELNLSWNGMPSTLVIPGQAGTAAFSVAPLAAPPAKVRVVSGYGGLSEFQVTTGIGTAPSATIPVAVNDDFTILEDSGATPFNVLANDTLNGSPIVFDPATVVVTIVGGPGLGTAVVNSTTGTIDYTPNLNANGTEGISYTVTFGTAVSPVAYLTINITPVNDAPVAVNDSTSAVANVPQTINVLANDTDVDGQADLANALNVTPSDGLAINSVTGGVVNFTAAVAGTYSFSYQAQDQAGAVSTNAATATVTVAGSETITVARSQFVSKPLRWRVDGTDNLPAGQTLTFTYADGNYRVAGVCPGASAAGTVVGTTIVDPIGAWSLDKIVSVSGILNPTNAGNNVTGGSFWCTPPRQLNITSPLGGTASPNITIK